MMLRFSFSSQTLTIEGGKTIPAWCKVRTLAAGTRGPAEVVRSIPEDLPYDPRPFPMGRWQVLRPQPRQTKYLAPYFIPTTAFQEVPVLKVERNRYTTDAPVGTTIDRGYGLHFSSSITTVGCVRIQHKADLLELVAMINTALDRSETVHLEVVL